MTGDWRLANKRLVDNYKPLFLLSKYKLACARWCLAPGRRVTSLRILGGRHIRLGIKPAGLQCQSGGSASKDRNGSANGPLPLTLRVAKRPSTSTAQGGSRGALKLADRAAMLMRSRGAPAAAAHRRLPKTAVRAAGTCGVPLANARALVAPLDCLCMMPVFNKPGMRFRAAASAALHGPARGRGAASADAGLKTCRTAGCPALPRYRSRQAGPASWQADLHRQLPRAWREVLSAQAPLVFRGWVAKKPSRMACKRCASAGTRASGGRRSSRLLYLPSATGAQSRALGFRHSVVAPASLNSRGVTPSQRRKVRLKLEVST